MYMRPAQQAADAEKIDSLSEIEPIKSCEAPV
jgi:hypothetical protein